MAPNKTIQIRKTNGAFSGTGSLTRRMLLKMALAAGATGAIPAFLFDKSWAKEALCFKASHSQKTLRTVPEWISEARIFGMAISGLQFEASHLEPELDQVIYQGANVIEADSRLSNYLSDKEFAEEIENITKATALIHARGLKVVWYYPSLEVITSNGRFRADTMARQHPNWLQLSLDRQRRGVVYGSKVFWLESSDESAWMCPNSPYRQWFQERLKRLAKTGVNGVWLDAVSLGSFVALWGCTCEYCQEKFNNQTGLDIPRKFNIADKVFWRFLRWRHETLTEFVEECQGLMQIENPDLATFIEVTSLDHLGAAHWGTEGESMTKNFIVWEQDGVSETTAMADASYDDWIAQYSIYKYCRGATADRPSWAFCYGYNEQDAQLVMASAVAAQNNPYETRIPNMSTSVGKNFRRMMYTWIGKYSKSIFHSKSLAQVAVLYSARNRDFLDSPHFGGKVFSPAPPGRDRQWSGNKYETPEQLEYMGDYRGLSMFCYQHQIPADILPVSRLDKDLLHRYKVLMVPYMATLSKNEKELLVEAVQNGATAIISGPTPGVWDEEGNKRNKSLWDDLFDVNSSDSQFSLAIGRGQIHFWRTNIGRNYLRDKDQQIRTNIYSWLKVAGIEPWTVEKLPVIVQPYVYERQVIIHILNYSWVGGLTNKPTRILCELAIPRSIIPEQAQILQSEPQWPSPRPVTFTIKGDKAHIPLKVGINSLLTIQTKNG